jgi:hypothetical protein
MSRKVIIGWDEAARQGCDAMGKRPVLTLRKDLGSINHDTKAGWNGATPGTQRRVEEKLK